MSFLHFLTCLSAINFILLCVLYLAHEESARKYEQFIKALNKERKEQGKVEFYE